MEVFEIGLLIVAPLLLLYASYEDYTRMKGYGYSLPTILKEVSLQLFA
jgi:hypothetical protein